ncbi:hypothetical protein LRS13_06240 [Svornostia abyssi]|uniref:Uncharacterized protein n=1 Tax=Svornostia abyssi TaxID=2898438 RepID=A0ABY5PKQ5_9ACTN|nr:hypothetical protein LRS13_06240 [Parviterribacteraceae bacterium J379]
MQRLGLVRRAIVVCPANLASKWVADFERFFGGGLRHLTANTIREDAVGSHNLWVVSLELAAVNPAVLWGDANPRASERAATFIFLASIVGTLRPGRGRGASAPEVKAACSVPDLSFTVTDADTVIEELVSSDTGMSAVEVIPGQGHNKPARYFLSTRLTHRMLVDNIRRTITDGERDEVIAEFTQRLSSSGPFRDLRFVEADINRKPDGVLATAGIDTAHTTRLVVLDPAQFSLRNGSEQSTIEALTIAMGLGAGTTQLPVQWASSCVFAVVNTQRRSNARGMAVEYLARKKALAAPEIQGDDELKATGTKELAASKDQFEKAIKRAFQHVAYFGQPDPEGERRLEQLTFDDEHSTSLDGAMVWKALVERDKVFDAGAFTAKALVHNLRDSDYGRTLSDSRASFYSAPRLPLLYAGDRDLQQAIYDAVQAGAVLIIDGASEAVAVTAPNQVNLASAGLWLAKPKPAAAGETGAGSAGGATGPGGERVPPGGTGEDGLGSAPGGAEPGSGGAGPGGVVEQQIAFSFTKNLLGDGYAADDLAAVFKAIYQALDERGISYGQGTLQLVVKAEIADQISQRLEALGINAAIKSV